MSEKVTLLLFSMVWVILCLILKYSKTRNRKKWYYFSAVVLCVIFGFRRIDTIYGGSDTLIYISQFLNVKAEFFLSRSEILFRVYMYALRLITDNSRVFIVFNTAITTSALLYFIYNYYEKDDNYSTLYLIWPIFIYYTCNAIRNGIAISSCLLSVVALKEKKNKRAVLFAILGFLFHYSAVFYLGYLVFYYLYDWLRSKRVPNIMIISGAIAILMSIVPIMNRFFYSSRYTFLAEKNNGSFLGMAPYYMIGVLAVIFRHKLVTRERHKECLYGTYYLCLLIPVVALYGIYRAPYFFVGILAVTAADIIHLVSQRYIAKSSRPVLSIIASLVFFMYGVLKLWTVGEQSGILLYRLF